MQKELIITADSSHSISIPELQVTYHSIYGAIQESKHVFIEAGLKYVLSQSAKARIRILEMGFGTGLNALLTAIAAEEAATSIYYVALEPFPITVNEANSLNYCEQLGRNDLQEDFTKMHEREWNKSFAFAENVLMHKSNCCLQKFEGEAEFHIVYYDAFAPNAQPELWTKEIFEKLFQMLQHNGVVVTYCAKGEVRRVMMAAGFKVEKLKGPPGKRQMLRAVKTNP